MTANYCISHLCNLQTITAEHNYEKTLYFEVHILNWNIYYEGNVFVLFDMNRFNHFKVAAIIKAVLSLHV